MTASDPQLRIANLERELHWSDLKRQSLIEEMRQLRIKFFGPKSETLSSLQLELLAEEEPSATRDEVEAEAQREPITQTVARTRKPHPGRKPLPEKLPLLLPEFRNETEQSGTITAAILRLLR